jgi:hypothetical protein
VRPGIAVAVPLALTKGVVLAAPVTIAVTVPFALHP